MSADIDPDVLAAVELLTSKGIDTAEKFDAVKAAQRTRIRPGEYELIIRFVVSDNETTDDLRAFLDVFTIGQRVLNATTGEEGPFLAGTVADVQITRRPT